MNGEDFYEWFKDVIHYFGVEWGNKNFLIVSVKDNIITISYSGMSVSKEFNNG